MSHSEEIIVSKQAVPTFAVVILAVIFGFGLFLVGYDQGHLFSIIEEEYIEPGKVNLVFKDFPLNGPDSILAAEAAYCAGDQGKYWSYHDELYANWKGERTGWVNMESLNSFARTVEIDIEKFNSCIDDHKYLEKVLDLEQFGREIGIDATPSFLIFNDEKIIKIIGNQPIDVFRNAIEELSNTTA